MNNTLKYVLVTPTRDEEKTIGQTIASVVAQTNLPAEWVIVSDGSTDRTDEIIEQAQKEHTWIKLIKLPLREGRCFGAVAKATQLATKQLRVKDYEYLGLLDSDLKFETNYFEMVLAEFQKNPRLGLAGGRVLDPDDSRNLVPDNLFDVPGSVQFFRRNCFEKLSDIYAIPEGGWDTLTCAESRMNGFDTKLLINLVVDHLKPRNIAHGGIVQRRWQCGVREYCTGSHPLFQLVKCARRIKERPFFISAIARWSGYLSAFISNRKRVIPPELISHVRHEQLERLKHTLFGRFI